MAGRHWAARLCSVLLAGLPLGCASGGGGAARVAAPPEPAAGVSSAASPSSDPAAGPIARAQAHTEAGRSAADEGEIDEASAAAEPAAIDGVGALPVSDAPSSAEAMARAVAAVESETPDLPVELNDAVLSCIDLYQGRLFDWFQEALSRGQKYLPEIRRVFAEEGIPQDLAYVALVESAFKTNAYSRAKAKGVFQFISATGRRYGLAVDWWVDERSDPDKATRAAARYLKDLHTLFGDWNLALAGYNAGENKVLRGMARYRKSDYWELRKTRALRPETKNYVPLIHAAIVLAKAPERYGFVITKDARREWEAVAVAGAYDLRVVAECAGEPVETLRELNPELRRLATPADRNYDLRVPPGRGDVLQACLADLPADKRFAYRKHVVRRGQTLASIARANGVTARAIAEANLLVPQRRLRPGSELVIPVPAGRAKVVPVRREASRAPRDRPHALYRVEPGDTLGSIAAEHGTTVRKLQAWNGLEGTRITAGSVLKIYGDPQRD